MSALANEASWRSGYAEDCKSLYGGSIPSEASNFFNEIKEIGHTGYHPNVGMDVLFDPLLLLKLLLTTVIRTNCPFSP